MELDNPKEIIKSNNEVAKSYKAIDSAVDEVIKKYKKLNENTENGQDSWKSIVKESEKFLSKYSGEIAKSFLPEDIQESFGKLNKSINKIKLVENITNQIIKIGRSKEQFSIETAYEGIKFNTLEEWNGFYTNIKDARVEELKHLQGNNLQKKVEEYEKVDQLMALELKKYTKLNSAKDKYHKAASIRYTDLSFWLGLITGTEKSPYQSLLEYKKDVQNINSNHEEEKQKILNSSLNIKNNNRFSINKNNLIAENRLKAEKSIESQLEKQETDKTKFFYDIQEKLTNIMDEGYEKRLRIINLNYEKEKQAAEDSKKQKLKDQEDLAKNIYIKEHGSDEGFDINKFDQSLLPIGLQTSNITSQYEQYITAADAKQLKEVKSIDKEHERLLKDEELRFSSSLEKQLNEIEKNYEDRIALAKGNETLITQYKINKDKEIQQATLQDKIKKSTNSEQLEQENLKGLQSMKMTELYESKKLEIKRKYLKERLELNLSLAKTGDENAEKEAKKIEFELNNLKFDEPAKSLKAFADEAVFNQIVSFFERLGSSPDEAERKTISLFNSIIKNATLVANVVGELQSMFGGLDENIDMVLSTVGNIAQGFAKGGPVGGMMAIVSEGINLFKKASEAEKRHQDALKAITDGRNAAQHQYNLLLLEQNLLMKEASSIFGEQQIAKAKNAINNYGEAVKLYKETLKGEGKVKNYNWFSGVSNFLNSSTKTSDIAALQNARIVTGHKKTGFLGLGKGEDTYSGILSVYPDLIDGENKLNIERAKTILNNEKMEDGTQTLLQNLIGLQEHAAKAEEELNNYLKDTFGSLGDSLTNSIVQAFANGEDAAAKFKENVTDVLNNLAKQMVFQLFLSKMFEKLEGDIEAIYKKHADKTIDEKQLSEQITNVLGNFFDGLGENIDSANDFLEQFWSNAENKGFERPQQATPTPSSGAGLASITQDSANQLNGSFDNMLRYTSAIHDNTEQSLLVQRTMQSQLNRIADNTEYCRYLENVKNSLEEMQTKGVKLKV
ncbi:hypothetical protein [Dysgonomonas reticulitermitis]